MATEMEVSKCDICLGEEQKVFSSPFLRDLLLKHQRILVCDEIWSCEGCSKLLHLWDEFLDESRHNLNISHPNAVHQYKQEEFGLKFQQNGVEDLNLKPEHPIKSERLECETKPIKEEVSCEAVDQKHQVFDCTDLFQHDKETMAKPVSVQLLQEVPPTLLDFAPLVARVQPDLEENGMLIGGASGSGVRPDGSVSPPYVAMEGDEMYQEMSDDVTSSHLLPSSSSYGQHKCLKCSRTFSHEILLNNHIKLSHTDNPSKSKLKRKSDPCPRCDAQFSQPQTLVGHILEFHSEQRDGQFLCILCEKLVTSRCDLKYHLRTHFPNVFNFKCKYCKKVLSTRQKLQIHIKSEHEDEDYLPGKTKKSKTLEQKSHAVCHFCYKVLSSKNEMLKHISRLHKGETKGKKHMCQVCGNGFTTKKGLVHHMSYHDLPPDNPSPTEHHNVNGSENFEENKPKLKLKIINRSGSLSCQIKDNDCLDAPSPPTFVYTVDSIEIPVPQVTVSHISETRDCPETPRIKSYFCYFCDKHLLAKHAMEYHIKHSHIKSGHHLTHGSCHAKEVVQIMFNVSQPQGTNNEVDTKSVECDKSMTDDTCSVQCHESNSRDKIIEVIDLD